MADSGTVTRWERPFLSVYLVIFALLVAAACETDNVAGPVLVLSSVGIHVVWVVYRAKGVPGSPSRYFSQKCLANNKKHATADVLFVTSAVLAGLAISPGSTTLSALAVAPAGLALAFSVFEDNEKCTAPGKGVYLDGLL